MTMYFGVLILTELILLGLILHIVSYKGLTKSQKSWYIITFAAIMFCALAEYAVHCGYYDYKWAVPLTILTVVQFSVAPLLSVLFAGALGLKSQALSAILVFGLNLVIEASSAPFGSIFYFDKDGYHRGILFIAYQILYLLSLAYLIISMCVVGRKFKHRDVITIIMIPVIIVAGIIPMTVAKIHITYLSIAMCAALCYIYYNDLVQQDIKAALVKEKETVTRIQEHTILGLSNLIENRDMETGEHITRTSAYVKRLALCARENNVYKDIIDDTFVSRLYSLSPMHDIGKIIVSDRILRKPGRLTPEEYEEMKKHAEAGGRIVREVLSGITDEDYVSFAADIATYHHEHWDGTGYPKGLMNNEIPLSARIMAIADVYDALVSKRCYKEPMSKEDALYEIEIESGTHFDPNLVEIALKHPEIFDEN